MSVECSRYKDVDELGKANGNGAVLALRDKAVPLKTKQFPATSPTISKTSGKSSVSPTLDEAILNLGPVYYDISRKEYLTQDCRQRWLPMNESGFRRRCKLVGLSSRAGEGMTYSPFDSFAVDLQNRLGVDYVGPIAGYAAGLHEEGEARLLVTVGPSIPTPRPGDWKTLRQVIENALSDGTCEQVTFWHGWLKVSLSALQAGKRKPGQCMVLVGPAESGKTLLQDMITACLGGREAKPYAYMTGQTGFNGEMGGAEHLRIGDENPHTDMRARRNFGAQIKNITVESSQRIESKFYPAVVLRPFWRLSVSLNDEPENLLVLPPLDEHTLDKLTILRTHKRPMPMPTATSEERAAFWDRITAELPHYVDWLLNDFSIPSALVSQRYGISHFHHPEIVKAVEAFESYIELLTLIDAQIFAGGETGAWNGTSEELERELTSDGSRVARSAAKLLNYRGACGRLLSQLSGRRPERVKNARTETRREWEVCPAQGMTD